MTGRKRAAAVAVLIVPLLFAFAVRKIALQAAWNQPLEPDAAAFYRIASQPASFFAASEREPLFIFLDRLALHLTSSPSAVRLQSFFPSLLLCLVLGLIGLRLFQSRFAAAVPPIVFALTPFAVFMASRGLREELFLAFALLYFDQISAGPERSRLNLALASLFGAGLVLTRESGFFFLVASTGLAFIKQWQTAGFKKAGRRTVGRLALNCLVPLAVAAALAAPFFINQRRHYGHAFHISRRDATFWRNQEFRDRPGHASSAEVTADPYRGPEVSSFSYLFRDHAPTAAIAGMARGYGRALTFYYPHMLGKLWWLMLLALPGIYRLGKMGRWEWLAPGVLLLLPFSFILTLSVVGHDSVDARFAFAGYPGLLLLIGAGFDLIRSWRTERTDQSESATT